MSELDVDGLNSCIAKVSLTITQGSNTETKELTPTAGKVQVDLGNSFDWTKDISFSLKVTEVKRSPECEGFSASENYVFRGKPPEPSHPFSISFSAFTQYRSISVAAFGRVSGGGTEVDKHLRILLWATPDSGKCNAICWQQWANTQLFWLDGATAREIADGKGFTDASGHHQTFGKYGRDLPEHSVGNCFHFDDVPNVPGAKGIVDAPNIPTTKPNANALFENAKIEIKKLNGQSNPPFTIRYKFSMYSVLWCDDTPAKIIGYYSWTAVQDWNFTSATQVTISNYTIDANPKWTTGTTDLPADQQKHD